MTQTHDFYPFLISRNETEDYRVIVAPDFIIHQKLIFSLKQATGKDSITESRILLYCSVNIEENPTSNFTLFFKVEVATDKDIGKESENILKIGTRDILLIYGFICQNLNIETELEDIKPALSSKYLQDVCENVRYHYQNFWNNNTEVISSSIIQVQLYTDESSLELQKSRNHPYTYTYNTDNNNTGNQDRGDENNSSSNTRNNNVLNNVLKVLKEPKKYIFDRIHNQFKCLAATGILILVLGYNYYPAFFPPTRLLELSNCEQIKERDYKSIIKKNDSHPNLNINVKNKTTYLEIAYKYRSKTKFKFLTIDVESPKSQVYSSKDIELKGVDTWIKFKYPEEFQPQQQENQNLAPGTYIINWKLDDWKLDSGLLICGEFKINQPADDTK